MVFYKRYDYYFLSVRFFEYIWRGTGETKTIYCLLKTVRIEKLLIACASCKKILYFQTVTKDMNTIELLSHKCNTLLRLSTCFISLFNTGSF